MTKTFVLGFVSVLVYVELGRAGVSLWWTWWLMVIAGVCMCRLWLWRER